MTHSFNASQYVAFMAPLAKLDIDSSWLQTIEAHVDTAEKMAAIVYDTPIDNNTIDLAGVYCISHPIDKSVGNDEV